MKGRSCMVALMVMAVVASVGGSVGDNELDGGERVVFVAPVLAPPRGARTHGTDRARQFPVLVLLSRPDLQRREEPEVRSLESPQPIYVKKLGDQDRLQHNRQKRHLKMKHGHGGGNGGGYQQQPVQTIVVRVVKENRGYGGQQQGYQQQQYQPQPVYHQIVYQQPQQVYRQQPQQVYHQQPQQVYHQQPQQVYHQQPSGCGGGCGGGRQSGSSATATATAYAQSSSQNYKK